MKHRICRVDSVEVLEHHRLGVGFDDGTQEKIDLEPILAGKLYGPLRDLGRFEQVRIDPEVHTVVWPNGTDSDPATLHDWPEHEKAMPALARRRTLAEAV